MKTKFTKEPHSLVNLEVTLSTEEFQAYYDRALQSAGSKVELKGFRPGNAPRALAEQAVNKEKVFDEAVNTAVRVSLQEAADEQGWILVDSPKIEVKDAHPHHTIQKVESEKSGLSYSAKLTIFPEVKLGDYKKQAHEVLAEKKEIVISDEEVETALLWLRKSRAKLVRKNDAIQSGDVVEGDIMPETEGKPIENGTLMGDRFVIGESRFIPGFDEKLIGHKEGEEVVFTLQAPIDYWRAELQGKEIKFKVRIKAVYLREIPELNDAFSLGLGPNFKTVQELKTNIKKGITLEKEEKQKQELRTKLLEVLVKSAEIDPPKILIDRTLENMLHEARHVMQETGRAESYTDEKLKEELMPRAKERVFAQLVLHKLAELEALSPNKEEVEAFMKSKNLDVEKYYDYSYGILLQEKVFSFLERF